MSDGIIQRPLFSYHKHYNTTSRSLHKLLCRIQEARTIAGYKRHLSLQSLFHLKSKNRTINYSYTAHGATKLPTFAMLGPLSTATLPFAAKSAMMSYWWRKTADSLLFWVRSERSEEEKGICARKTTDCFNLLAAYFIEQKISKWWLRGAEREKDETPRLRCKWSCWNIHSTTIFLNNLVLAKPWVSPVHFIIGKQHYKFIQCISFRVCWTQTSCDTSCRVRFLIFISATSKQGFAKVQRHKSSYIRRPKQIIACTNAECF